MHDFQFFNREELGELVQEEERLEQRRKDAQSLARELKRILHFVDTAREARTRLPIHVAIAGERDASSEAQLLAAGVGLVRTPLVPPPRWASRWHRLSFSKIAALSLTQFDKVIVVDNDAALLRNMDELALAPAPAAVDRVHN